MHLRAGKKKAADAVDIARRWLEFAGLPVDRLNRTEAAVGVDVREHCLPRFLDDGQIRLAVENLFVDPIRDPKGEEGRTGDLGQIVRIRIKQAGTPQAIRTLNRRNFSGHLAKLRDVLRP